MIYPTSYPEINTVLDQLLAGVQATLQEQFVGLYLYGSLATGDFDPQTSDIDFLVVTTNLLSIETFLDLTELHQKLLESGLKWAAKLEGSYLPQDHLQRYSPPTPLYPTLNEGSFYLARHGYDWVLQRHILREHGVVVHGPSIRLWIDPISPNELRRAVADLLQDWWLAMYQRQIIFQEIGYRVYAVLSMCRALYTLEYGLIASKPTSAHWAQTVVGEKWADLIAQALQWRTGMAFDGLAETLGLIGYTLDKSYALFPADSAVA